MDTDRAINLADEIIADADRHDFPPAGAEFAASVGERAAGIRATIVRTRRVTPAQMRALENMADGLGRWLRRRS